jgi:Xaa-Pro aminopeptidase
VEPFGPEVFRERRARLLERIKTGVGLVYAAEHIDPAAEKRQDADFLYLTGLPREAGAALLLRPQDQPKEILLLAPRNPERDRWTGYRAGLPSRALEVRTGFAVIRRIDLLPSYLTADAHRFHELHFLGPVVPYHEPVPHALEACSKAAARVPGTSVHDSSDFLPRMRMVKEPRELEQIARAVEISVAGHRDAMLRVRPGMREWQLKQIVEDGFRRAGGRSLAYESIVGAGPDGCVLHYPQDDRLIAADELVLVDAGAESGGYASDVTRTFPASGKFSPEQRKVYEVVRRAQQAALERVRPGVTWNELESAATRVIADAGYYDYYIHRLGHYVGLEVHDAGSYDDPIPENAVITVEPGIYMPGAKIGVRIEDTLVVTRGGPRILSDALPRDPDAIERLMAQGRP